MLVFSIVEIRFLFLFAILVCFVSIQGQLEGEPCVREYDDLPGTCKFYRECPKSREDHRKGIPPTQCAIINKKYIVCCPDEAPVATSTRRAVNRYGGQRISKQKCEEYAKETFTTSYVNTLSLFSKPSEMRASKCNDTTPLIVGGTEAKKGELPHMAAIGWTRPEGIAFRCGGSLISDKFVLTAAHCIPQRDPPTIVRLGDKNLHSKSDGLEELDVPIQDFIIHEEYGNSKNDIALLKLRDVVKFTEYIRPACLWQTQNIDKDRVTAAGWGKTEGFGSSSDVLLKVGLNIIPSQQCQSTWREAGLVNFTISDTQMCAGDLAGGKDTCGGDSGGPIVLTKDTNNCLFYVVGVTSLGAKDCGKAGFAGVYTRVSSYLDWIEDKVWNQE